MRVLRTPRRLFAVAALAVAAVGLPVTLAGAADTESHTTPRATVRDVNGNTLGSVTLSPNSGRIVVNGRLSGLTPGFHGFHIHAVGICNPRSTDPNGVVVPFLTAGGHLNPAGTTHGDHAGDLPALLVQESGNAVGIVETDQVTFAQIFDADGSAIIVHAAPDNLAHIPTRYSAAGVPGPDAATLATGDAGGRVGCGVIVRG